jgi:D-alanyl-D-alanine carboxypeptidase
MPHMKLGKNRLVSHNGLLKSLEGADGLKTGFTCDSGFNIVASATRDGRRLVAVVLGDSSSGERNLRAASLLEYGFQQYAWTHLFNDRTLETMPFLPTATGVKSVRASVESWGCNGKKPRVANSAKQRKRTAKKAGDKTPAASDATDKLKGAQANAGAPPAVPEVTTGSVTPAAAQQ